MKTISPSLASWPIAAAGTVGCAVIDGNVGTEALGGLNCALCSASLLLPWFATDPIAMSVPQPPRNSAAVPTKIQGQMSRFRVGTPDSTTVHRLPSQ
ncbi:hypothetical protein Mkiyose1088_44730 [Mycobacterium kiyosense]|nr:hypothetical protein Mkiyose1088_44730 [Mycobacterium kiyosense]